MELGWNQLLNVKKLDLTCDTEVWIPRNIEKMLLLNVFNDIHVLPLLDMEVLKGGACIHMQYIKMKNYGAFSV